MTQRKASFPKSTLDLTKQFQYQEETNTARSKKEADACKSKHISVRLTETEYKVYKEYARRGGFTLSELIRLMMVKGKVGYRLPIVVEMPQRKEITAQLVGIGNNLNQITRHLHTGGLLTDELQKDINA